MSRRGSDVTPELVLRAYRAGLFPMAEGRDADRLHWMDPKRRGILPLEGFHAPRRLLRSVRQNLYDVTADQDFPAVMAGCAQAAPGREQTWINGQIARVFTELHIAGYAHSIECRQQGTLVGGLYGVALGGAFFGESMFSTARDASKIALVHLVARLRLGGFRLLDTQFVTTHLAQFGACEIASAHYRALLEQAIATRARFLPAPPPELLAKAIAALQPRPAGQSNIASSKLT